MLNQDGLLFIHLIWPLIRDLARAGSASFSFSSSSLIGQLSVFVAGGLQIL